MKLIRVGRPGEERPGVLNADGERIDATDAVHALGHRDYDEAFFGDGGLAGLEEWTSTISDATPRLDPGARLGAPVARPSKIVCIGLNFRDHAAETGQEPPTEPIVFFKASSALCGPDDDVFIPPGSTKTDWEVELAVVMGAAASHVTRDEAGGLIAGYALHNDYSEREYQLERGGQWVKGKSYDHFAPVGPWLATPTEFPDGVDDLAMWLSVNDHEHQRSSTAQLIFDVPTLIATLSEFMTLLPGDIISTGTPGGVGLSYDPPVYLRSGDTVRLGIEGLGTSTQRAVDRVLPVR